jgi:hypothetical protein
MVVGIVKSRIEENLKLFVNLKRPRTVLKEQCLDSFRVVE